jgi:hypothetical protein
LQSRKIKEGISHYKAHHLVLVVKVEDYWERDEGDVGLLATSTVIVLVVGWPRLDAVVMFSQSVHMAMISEQYRSSWWIHEFFAYDNRTTFSLHDFKGTS